MDGKNWISRLLIGVLLCAPFGSSLDVARSAVAEAPAGRGQGAVHASALADQADLDVTIVEADTTVELPGQDIQYNITVVNNGPDAATNVRVTFSINYVGYIGFVNGGSAPGGWSCSTAPDARSRTCDIASLSTGVAQLLSVLVQPTGLGVYVGDQVAVVISSSTEDPTGGNNSASPGNVTVFTNATNADAVSEVVGYVNGTGSHVTQAQPGSRVVLYYGGRNAGPAISSYTTTLDVPGGATLMTSIEYEHNCVDNNTQSICGHTPAVPHPSIYPPIYSYMLLPSTAGVHTSTVSALSGGVDPLPGNDVKHAPITVTNFITKADLRIDAATVKPINSFFVAPIQPGGGALYELEVFNAGPGDANNTELIIPLYQHSDAEFGDSPAFAAIKFAPVGWSCNPYTYGRAIICRTSVLTASTGARIIVHFAAGQTPGIYKDFPIIGSDSGDPDTGNNSTSVVMEIADVVSPPQAFIHLEASHQSGQVPLPSGTFAQPFVFTATNEGPDDAPNALVTFSWDHYGAAWDYGLELAPPGWTCLRLIGFRTSLYCYRSEFPAGSSAVFTMLLNAPAASVTTDMRVCGLATSDANNVLPTRYSPTPKFACDTYYVTPFSANIRVEGRDSPDPVNAGGTLTYFIGVHNAGPNDLASGFYRTLDLNVAPGVAFQQLIGPSGWSAVYTLGSAWQFYFPPIAAGGGSTATIIVAAPSITGSIAATATVRASDYDVDLSDNTTVIRTRVSLGENAADLRPEIYPLADFEACVASTVPITAVTANLGPDVADSLRMTITSSGPDTISSLSAGCTAIDGFTLACAAPALNAGQNFTALVQVGVMGATPSTIMVTSSSDTPDGNSDDNSVIRVIRPIACATATPTPTQTPTNTPTATPTATNAPPTATHTPTATATPTATGAPPTATSTPTQTQTPTATATGAPPTATHTPTATATSTATDTPPTATQTPTATGTPLTATPTATPTQTPTPTATEAPPATATPTATATSPSGGGRTPRGFLPLVVR